MTKRKVNIDMKDILDKCTQISIKERNGFHKDLA